MVVLAELYGTKPSMHYCPPMFNSYSVLYP